MFLKIKQSVLSVNKTKLESFIKNIIFIFLVFGLNFIFFRFQSYAIFRDYIIVRNQDFNYNNSNPISFICDFLQNNLFSGFSLNQISSFYYILLFSLGFLLTNKSLVKIYVFFKDLGASDQNQVKDLNANLELENLNSLQSKQAIKKSNNEFKNKTNYEKVASSVKNTAKYQKNKFLTDFTIPFSLVSNIEPSSESNISHQTDPQNNRINLGHLEHFSLILLTILFCYNSFVLERFLMGQDRIFWGYFLILPYIYNLLKYLISLKTNNLSVHNLQNKVWLVVLSILVSLSNIHMMVILTIISICFGFGFWLKKVKVFFFSVFNLMLIFVSLLFNFKLFNTSSSSYYLNNIVQNTDQYNQIIDAFSAQTLSKQNLIERVLIGAGSWNTPTFVEIGQINKYLGGFSYFSLYFNHNWNIIYLIFLGFSLALGIYLLTKISYFRVVTIPFCLTILASLVLSFGYSLEFFKGINQFILSIPGAYIFREPGKLYIIFEILIVLLICIILSKLINFKKQNNVFLAAYLIVLGSVAISSFLPFFQLSNSLNYLRLPNLVNYTLANCQNRTLAVLPSTTYLIPNYSKVFIANPFLVTKNQNCKIIKSNKVELSTKDGDTIKLDISGENEKFDQVMTKYLDNLPKINNGEIIINASNLTTNTSQLTTSLKEIQINLLFVDFNAIDYKLYLKNDLDKNAKLIQQEGSFALYEL